MYQERDTVNFEINICTIIAKLLIVQSEINFGNEIIS